MRKKQWIILVIALAAIVAASAGLNGYQKKQDQKAAQQEEDEKVYALQFTSDDVTGISYEYSGETLEFTKTDDTWSCNADPTVQIDADKMKTMLSSLGSMTADSTVENPEDVSEYGIDQPTQQVPLRHFRPAPGNPASGYSALPPVPEDGCSPAAAPCRRRPRS